MQPLMYFPGGVCSACCLPLPGGPRSPCQEKICPGPVAPLEEDTWGSGPVRGSRCLPAPSCPVGLGGCGVSLGTGESGQGSWEWGGKKSSPGSLVRAQGPASALWSAGWSCTLGELGTDTLTSPSLHTCECPSFAESQNCGLSDGPTGHSAVQPA